MGRLILFLLTVIASSAAAAAPLTVVGFNVESGDASDHVISLQLENSVGVDLWGLADVWDARGWPERLQEAAAVGEGAGFGAILGKSGGDSRLLVLFRQDRLQYLGSEEIAAAQVSEREPVPLAVRLRLDGEGEFWFLVVDLSDSQKRRVVQTQALAEWSARQSLPIVATGTFRFGVREDGEQDPAMGRLLEAGWRWSRPVDFVGTSCDARDRIEDFVFLAGPASLWGSRAEVMYPQSNYCPDDGRTSNHRPVLANVDPAGGTPAISGSMPERQVRPFFPEKLADSGGRETELANEPVTPAAPGPASQVLPAGMLPAAAKPATGSAAPADSGAGREELLRRLEALEAEAERLRREIETTGN